MHEITTLPRGHKQKWFDNLDYIPVSVTIYALFITKVA